MSSSAACEPKDLLTDVLSTRVPPGFGDQVRAAARAAGVRPGELIRRAVSDGIAKVAQGLDVRDDNASATAARRRAGLLPDSLVREKVQSLLANGRRVAAAEAADLAVATELELNEAIGSDPKWAAETFARIEKFQAAHREQIRAAHACLGAYLNATDPAVSGTVDLPHGEDPSRLLNDGQAAIAVANELRDNLALIVLFGVEA